MNHGYNRNATSELKSKVFAIQCKNFTFLIRYSILTAKRGDGMIPREEYLDNLVRFRDKDLIKVVTGIRRCGKSTLFELYQDYLCKNGVKKEQIIAVNLEDGDYGDIEDSRGLYELVNSRLIPDQMNYIFLDEVQRVREFQKAVDALYIKKNCDVYITGSNAKLLSGELATYLAGQYVEFII